MALSNRTNIHHFLPLFLMILVQLIYTGMNIIYKLAVIDVMSIKVLTAYRWICASVYAVPVALFLERNRPTITWKVLGLAFLAGLFGGLAFQFLYAESLALTSATFAVAFLNLAPAVTLILAAAFGLEKLGFRTNIGKVKALGITVGIGGAMLISFYRGLELKFWSINIHLPKMNNSQQKHDGSNNYILGFVCASGSCISYALWLIIQTKLSKIYPLHHTNAALTSVMASVQCVIFALSTERDWGQWNLGWNLRLLTVVYAGTISSGAVMTFVAYCVRVRGAVFVSSFSPLSLVLVAFFAHLLLQEPLHIGSVLGATAIVCGLYMLLWAKNKEMKGNAKQGQAQAQAQAQALNDENIEGVSHTQENC